MFNRSKAWAAGLLVAMGAAGFATGAASMNWLGERGSTGCSYSGRLTKELSLRAAQRESVAAIIRRHRPAMRALFETVRPQMDSIRAQIRAEIELVLTPAQREAYARLLERERAERAGRGQADSGRTAGPHDD